MYTHIYIYIVHVYSFLSSVLLFHGIGRSCIIYCSYIYMFILGAATIHLPAPTHSYYGSHALGRRFTSFSSFRPATFPPKLVCFSFSKKSRERHTHKHNVFYIEDIGIIFWGGGGGCKAKENVTHIYLGVSKAWETKPVQGRFQDQGKCNP